LFIFFSLAYLISWGIWWPLYAPVLGLPTYDPLPWQHALGALGPLFAGLYAAFKFRGLKGLASLILNTVIPPGPRYLLVALISPFLLVLVAAGILYFQNGVFPDISKLGLSSAFPEKGIVSFFFYNFIFFGLGEEVGWRGFALPVLQSRYNALVSAVIVTFLWALWHWPLFLYRPGYTSMDFGGFAGWFFSLLTGSVLLTWLFNSTRGSVMACAIFHSTIDIAFTSDYPDQSIIGLTGMLITFWGIATLFIFKPRNLSSYEKVTNVEGG
jgi:uncharacterized protein